MKKTNAARMLDRLHISYTLHDYAFDEEDLAAEKAAAALNLPEAQVFKTLLARGDKTGPCFFVLPADLELDPKAAAQASGNKHVDMVALKEVQPLTGYIRGGVSPLDAKKAYPVFLHETATSFPFISVSAGQRGCQLWLKAGDLLAATGGTLCPIAREHPRAEA